MFVITYRRFSKFARNHHIEFTWTTVFACTFFGLLWFLSLPTDILYENRAKIKLPKPPKWL